MAAATLLNRSQFRFKNVLLPLVRSSSFQALDVNEALIKRLAKLGIDCPTRIQEKAIPEVMQGKDVIINAETGSGKTLCYLVPIVHELINKPSLLTKPPYAVILLPTIELCHQAASVFRMIAEPHMLPCIVSRESRLLLADSYPVVMAMPSALLTYDLSTLTNAKMIVTDEADFLTTSGGKDVWRLLDFLKYGRQMKKIKHYGKSNRNNVDLSKVSQTQISDQNIVTERQFVFVAATLPSRGKKASLNVLTKWLPKGQLVATSLVHQKLPTLDVEYVKVTEETKFQQLWQQLDELAGISEVQINGEKKRVISQNDNGLRVLVFANSAEQASLAFQYVTGRKSSEVKNMQTDYNSSNKNHIENEFENENVIAIKSRNYWKNHCAELHKRVPIDKRLEALEQFKSGDLQVLICTDIASRGLDIPDVSHVIQLDFATNSAIVLHRTGRTARQGSCGKVINFITPKDEILARAIRACDEDPDKADYGATFSRNRMFRRRIKSLPLADTI